MTVQVTALRWVPPFARGYVKDLRVRWALEEAGIAYDTQLVDRQILDSNEYRKYQPFGQVPAYRDGEVQLFESGAIVLHLAANSDRLAPPNAAGIARVTAWVIAALNSVEPHVQNFLPVVESRADEAWAKERRPELEALLRRQLAALSAWLGDKEYLEGRFTAGDLIMTTVLRELVSCGILSDYANLDVHRTRCEARPAFARALAAQLRDFDDAPC